MQRLLVLLLFMVLQATRWRLGHSIGYKLTIITSKDPGSGTAGNISVMVSGLKNSSSTWELLKRTPTSFQEGSVDVFEVGDTKFGMVRQLQLLLQNNYVWTLDKMYIENPDTGKKSEFNCSCRFRWPNLIKHYFVKIDGGWSAWSAWSECGTNCGTCPTTCPATHITVGTSRSRTRTCDNPLPDNGGDACIGADRDYNCTLCIDNSTTTTSIPTTTTIVTTTTTIPTTTTTTATTTTTVPSTTEVVTSAGPGTSDSGTHSSSTVEPLLQTTSISPSLSSTSDTSSPAFLESSTSETATTSPTSLTSTAATPSSTTNFVSPLSSSSTPSSQSSSPLFQTSAGMSSASGHTSDSASAASLSTVAAPDSKSSSSPYLSSGTPIQLQQSTSIPTEAMLTSHIPPSPSDSPIPSTPCSLVSSLFSSNCTPVVSSTSPPTSTVPTTIASSALPPSISTPSYSTSTTPNISSTVACGAGTCDSSTTSTTTTTTNTTQKPLPPQQPEETGSSSSSWERTGIPIVSVIVAILVVFIIILVVGCLIKRQQKNRVEANSGAQGGGDEEADNPDGEAPEKPPSVPPPEDPEDDSGPPPQGGWMANGGHAIPRTNSKPPNGDIRKKGDPEPTLPNAVIDLEEPDDSSTTLRTLCPVEKTTATGAWPQYYPLMYRTFTPHTISLPGNQIVKGGSMSETKDIALCSVV